MKVLHTSSCKISVSTVDGTLRGLCFSKNGLCAWEDVLFGRKMYDRVGGIRVTDELTNVVYKDDLETRWVYYDEVRKYRVFPEGTPCALSNISFKQEKSGSCKLAFVKRFDGAPFDMLYTISADEKEVLWHIDFRLDAGEKSRSLKVEFSLPTLTEPMEKHQDFRPPWSLWAPVADAPFEFMCPGGWGHANSSWDMLRFPYCSVNTGNGIAVPVIDIHSSTRDVGLALAVPFDMHKPEFCFEVDKAWSEVRAQYSNIGLRPGNDVRVALMLHAHTGDWRPVLGWLFDKYTEYFIPSNDRIVEQEGPMSYIHPVLTDKIIRQWKKDMNFSWTEVLYLPTFADFVPRASSWNFDMMYPRAGVLQLDKQKIRNYLKLLKKHDVASFAYFNVCEMEMESAEKRFEESIMFLDDMGTRRMAYIWPDKKRKNWNMNPDPDSRWGEYILTQLEDLFDTYPELDGIFFDQLCYRTYDFSRDDGVTMLHNRACFDTHTVYPEMVRRVVEILRKYGKTAFANGPYNIEVQRGLDGIMSEGSNTALARYAYICLAKPVMILTYGSSLEEFEHTLKLCLKYGAFPDVRDHLTAQPRAEISSAEKALYQSYLPLIEELRGRRWVFHPNALKLPRGYDGNVFRNQEDCYLVTLFPIESVWSDRENLVGSRRLELKLPDLGIVSEAIWLNTNASAKRRLPLIPGESGSYILEVPEYADASVFVLQGTQHGGK